MNKRQIVQKTIGIVILVGIVLLIGFAALRMYTKSFSPEAISTYQNENISIEVKYCQPHKKGRVIFGNLVSYGEIWRTGANEATVVKFSDDVLINDKVLNAGKYSLFTIPDKNNWTVIFNEQTGQWGTMYKEKRDILRVDVSPEHSKEVQEVFTIDLTGEDQNVTMTLHWDKTRVSIPIEVLQ
ncbi:MAG TPA: hypothetical protein DDY13_12045 [Cytophagales bacterium]|jgi:hypothetical protein|nr:hypothetical protein [Cytophagales bacterium]